MTRFITSDGWSVEIISYHERGQRFLVKQGPFFRAETTSLAQVRRTLGATRFRALHEPGTRVQVWYRRALEPEIICCESPAEAQGVLAEVLADANVGEARILPD